jgi:hypothetical protein
MYALGLVLAGFVGTVFWPASPEAAVVLCVAERGWPPLAIGALAALGQLAAQAALFAGGDHLRRRWGWFDRKCIRARERYGARLTRGVLPLAAASGLLGLPPSSVTSALAPGLGLRASRLLPLLFVMRVVRFTVVAAVAGGLDAAIALPAPPS